MRAFTLQHARLSEDPYITRFKPPPEGPDKGNDGGDLHFREAQSAVAAEGQNTAREPAVVAAEADEAAPMPPTASTSDAAALGVAPQMVPEPWQGPAGGPSEVGWPNRRGGGLVAAGGG